MLPDGQQWQTRRMRIRALLVAIVAVGAGTNASAAAPGPHFDARPCPEVPSGAGLRCGVVRVPERHSAAAGREIELHVIVLPATDGTRSSVAQYDLEGGPGFAVTDFLEFYLGEGAPYRRSRDIILADMRGTGKSNPLRCPALEEYTRTANPSPLYPPDLVAACHKSLGAQADLAMYSTSAAARDIDLIRHALGYERLDLNAVSYGTTLGWRYIAEFPDRVHSAVFVGTVPADRTPPRFHAMAAERALSMLQTECARDPACAVVFGDLGSALSDSLRRFDGAGADMGRAIFMEKLRTLMYAPASQRRIPLLLQQAAKGDFAPFDAATRPAGNRSFADGLYLSLTCSESFGNFDVNAASIEARKTRFGDYRLARQRAACENWPTKATDMGGANVRGPFKVPVLFIAGDTDPVSPPEWAEGALSAFPNGRLVMVPHGAHVFDGLSGLDTCFDRVVIEFLARGSARGLDTSCFAQMLPAPYPIGSAK